MKKVILILLCCGMLNATVSCNKNVDIDFHINEFTQKEIEDIDTSTKQNKETISDREILERL